MRIAVILPKMANQGPIIVAKDVINNICTEVDKIDIYYFDDVIELDINATCKRISFFTPINFDSYDIIHSHMLRPDAYVWFHRRKIKKAICVSTLHQDIKLNLTSSYNKCIAFIFEKVWLYLLRAQDRIIMLTNTMRNQYLNMLAMDKTVVIYNGRDLVVSSNGISESDRLLLEQLKSKFTVIGVSALLGKRKGISQIIRSLVHLTNCCLVVIGNGKERDNLYNLAIELGVQDRLFLFGYRKDAYRYLNYFDIYCMSSYSEGFPLGLLEAGLNSLPVVCSDLPIFRELFDDSEVIFFELDNIKSLSESLLIANEKGQTLSKALFNAITTRYSLDLMANSYLNLYRELVLTK